LAFPPALDITFSAALIVPVILGFLVGLLLKKVLKVGILIAVIILVLIAIGVVAPDQVIKPLVSLARSGTALSGKVKEIASYLPYSSVTFLIGLALGFYKG
jgi:uncharacterized membrane protein (Fun14 family)